MNSRIILASGSPRRKELLQTAGLEFSVLVTDVNETPLKKESPQKMVARLSELKAHAASDQIREGDGFILAADTTVVSASGRNLGKPESTSEAYKMIQALQGKKHSVYTAYTVLKIQHGKAKKSITRTVRTDVFIKRMTKQDIEAYISKGESMDKAGAYAAQGFGMVLIEKISGSYTNVVGLPVVQVLADLKLLGWK
jgi:septum formation protein